MSKHSKISEYYRKEREKDEDLKKLAQDSKIYGTIVIFDLVNSTKLKQQKEFPNWIEDYIPFYDIITKPFSIKGIEWYKFLGDAFLFFIPEAIGSYPSVLKPLSVDKVYDVCKTVLKEYWEYYSLYKEKEFKGGEKHINFREITCAIDYGNEVFNWCQLVDDNAEKFDPIGKTIDRCFRFSSLAGSGQLITSEYFYKRLIDLDTSLKNEFELIHFKEGTLKGFPKIKDVYYSKPDDTRINYYLDSNNSELVENAKTLETKVKLKLFRNKVSNLENDIKKLQEGQNT